MYLKATMFFALLCACLPAIGNPPAITERQPNFIIIYTDDMGYSDAGPFGDPLIDTPALDSLAKKRSGMD